MRLKDRGSSIIEALSATVVISVGVLALALLTGGLVRGNRESDRVAAAVLAAEARLESLLAASPLNANGDLAPGPHPPDATGARYEALQESGAVVVGSIAASAGGSYHLLRRWVVTPQTSSRCLRNLRVSVIHPRSLAELASAETLFNCP